MGDPPHRSGFPETGRPGCRPDIEPTKCARNWLGARRGTRECVAASKHYVAFRRDLDPAILLPLSGCSAAWLARLTGGQKVVGSNPASPIRSGQTEGLAFRFSLFLRPRSRVTRCATRRASHRDAQGVYGLPGSPKGRIPPARVETVERNATPSASSVSAGRTQPPRSVRARAPTGQQLAEVCAVDLSVIVDVGRARAGSARAPRGEKDAEVFRVHGVVSVEVARPAHAE